MNTIKKAVEEFRNRRLGVYRADPDQIVRDARGAERATKDHVGRWLFELLQNSDDAVASDVRIFFDEDTIYVADNGNGLIPEAVSAICGTDFSDKTAGTIGRKGVGFKSVYEVSRNPQVLTVDGEGIEFNPDKAKEWLQQNNLDDGQVPYQWIPFFIPWDDARRQDLQLGTLTTYKTVVRLGGLSQEKRQKVEQLLMEWPPHALFAFRHLRRITAPDLEVVLETGDGVWSLRDSRVQTPVEWRVSRQTEHPPAERLEGLEEDERQAICGDDGVGFLIAAPIKNDCVVPTTDYLPVHVFYPTEQKGPVRLLLHAEFLVKSDRTALLPADSSPFNAWVADRLAYHVCQFVNGSYRTEVPSTHAALLVPFGDRASHPAAEDLWQRIAHKALADLRLADVEGRQLLTVSEARLISVSVRTDLARTLLETTSLRGRLLHSAFDDDKEARKALNELGCREIHDQDLIAAIAKNAASLASKTEWVWSCWEWLAAWVAKEPYGDKHKERVERARRLPIVPVDGHLLRASELAGRIVTWKPDVQTEDLPDWLPLTFVEDWFRDRIQTETEQDSSIKKLRAELGITGPGADVIQRAVGQAIEQYWKDKQGDPRRFLDFILEQDWHETADTSPSLRRCPVPLSQRVQGEAWSEADKAYFGREWENDLLSDLYDGMEAVAWVASDNTGGDKEKRRRILVWLGVAEHPRIVEEHHKSNVWQLPEGCGEWKQYLETARDYCGRRVERIAGVSRMDHLALDGVNARLGSSLLRLIAQHWAAYYRDHAEVTAEGTQSRERYYRSWPVKAKWWWEVCERLPLPSRDDCAEHVALASLWLPDKRTDRAIGDLLPVIDLDAFGNDKDAVREWLVSTVDLRTRIEQLTVEEWKGLLSSRIPRKAPAECLTSEERLRDRVMGWYTACLETVAEQENVSEKAFASCPLLCRKGEMWQYIADKPQYLNDDNDLATAFAQDVWLFHIPARLVSDAVKYLGVLLLSGSVQVDVSPGEPKSPLSDGLLARFNDSLPYVWAWRSSQSKQAADRLSVRLKGLKVLVAPALKASLSLDGMRHEVERRWHVDDDTIYLHRDHANETELAQALAKALGVRSEADFYENLLRCSDELQRKQKLLSKGIVDAEVERCLREYSGQPPEEEPQEKHESQDTEKPDTSHPPSAGGNESPLEGKNPNGPSGKTPEKTSQPPDTRKQPLRLKDPRTVEYVLGGPPEGEGGHGGGGGGGGTGQEGRSLTDTEKAELEAAGRALAARELESMGFSVEEMPQGNPGFDLRAKKDGDELRVEVKAHGGRATIVDVTQREYKEYLGQQRYRWELWNVEHLAKDDSHQVVITRYDQIPDDALDVRTFRVDLKRCQASFDSAENLT
ncbi:MAG: hypothetical protein DRH50_06390 [Deltaproteobacteria bacterium]|nr:MAG: hypothetical protein DRH50_06390 [Deltaproteobacteria bacterium]